MTETQPQSPTATPSRDEFGLGRTSGQRGAEILAGVRAQLTPSPITEALSTFGGRLVARIMIATMTKGMGKAGLNFVAVRTGAFRGLIVDHLRPLADGLLVELASGFSPRGMDVAEALPHIAVIEIDLPDVIHGKQMRLNKRIPLPQNLVMKAADLGVMPLAEVLENRSANVIAAEGLLPYFPREEQLRICRQIHANLAPGGLFVTDFAWRPGQELAREGMRFFTRQAGEAVGIIRTAEEAITLLTEAGFARVEALKPSELAPRYGLPEPVADLELFTAAYKAEDKAADKAAEA